MRHFIVGDIHGHYEEFAEILMLLIIEHEMDLDVDKLILLGDYIDRGPMSKEVVESIMKLEKQHGSDHVIALKGNHEDMCLNYHNFGENHDPHMAMNFQPNGGGKTLDSFGGDLPEDVLNWMNGLRLTYETDTHFFVHAGVNPEAPLDAQIDWDLMWIRGEFINYPHDLGKVVVFGHTPMKKVQILSNKIAMDTGIAYGYSLSAYILEEGKVVSVKAMKGAY